MPKQAHMADLQAIAAAKNLFAEQKGEPAEEEFKTELVCIIDTLQKGMLIFRNAKRTILLPKMRILSWSKRFFEWYYLRAYR
jgi:sulfide:quinone oxidoreductase